MPWPLSSQQASLWCWTSLVTLFTALAPLENGCGSLSQRSSRYLEGDKRHRVVRRLHEASPRRGDGFETAPVSASTARGHGTPTRMERLTTGGVVESCSATAWILSLSSDSGSTSTSGQTTAPRLGMSIQQPGSPRSSKSTA
ncbi:uncharacterized protein BDZ99DRAFT_36949 [Mytilinidion resinicola]|uniref:Secreted protein n=1 Tax=Mytilinidion resinicola TaxID=574789 RepID=A0A6A6YMN3_9PEZI|nr:uncharacterized protein BDZ99DRAFT_36949 [Mytilinidion resinicola]KAF2809819.1 hypothetical protein BDZ99DRAFT_36949 [Mytilinidion resinicola]